MSDGSGPGPEHPSSPGRHRPVVPYPAGPRPGGRDPLTKRQNWLVWLFFVPPLLYLAFLIVRSLVQK